MEYNIKIEKHHFLVKVKYLSNLNTRIRFYHKNKRLIETSVNKEVIIHEIYLKSLLYQIIQDHKDLKDFLNHEQEEQDQDDLKK